VSKYFATSLDVYDRQMKYKVVFVVPSFAGGGAERVIIMLANSLDRTRYIPSIIVLNAKGPLQKLIADDVAVVNLGRPRLRYAIYRLIIEIRKIEPDAVIPTMGYLNLCILSIWKKIGADIRVIVREANAVDATIKAIKLPFLGRFLYSYLYPRATKVITPSQLIAKDLRERWRVSGEKLVVLPNPVDTRWVRNQANKIKRHSGIGRRFVASGRLVDQKGFDLLIAWLRNMPPDTHVTIFGEGHMREPLIAQAKKMKVMKQLRFAGFVNNPWRFYAGADAFLLTSRWEGMSNASLEALAVGTPVIGTPQSGGLREVATQTTPLAITIAEPGMDYVNALMRVTPSIPSELRPSLLPDSYSLERANKKFEEILVS
tara:strand:+ start:1179 stop:2297 length:1119 start_codon:yes stop_codon:yes gene_type:complete